MTTPILITRIVTFLDITLHIHPAYNRNYLSLTSTLTWKLWNLYWSLSTLIISTLSYCLDQVWCAYRVFHSFYLVTWYCYAFGSVGVGFIVELFKNHVRAPTVRIKSINRACCHWSYLLIYRIFGRKLICHSVGSFITKLRLLQAEWLILFSNERAALHINMPYWKTLCFVR